MLGGCIPYNFVCMLCRLVAPGSGMDSSSVVFDVTYSNMGPEDSLEPVLRINNLPSTIFSGYDFLLVRVCV